MNPLTIATKRVRRATERWLWRLGVALGVSVALHSLPFVAAHRLGLAKPLDVAVHTVEIGLNTARPESPRPPSAVPPAVVRPDVSRVSASVRPHRDARPPVSPSRERSSARGSTRDARALQESDALPTVAGVARNLAPMVPRGALVTVLLHTERIRRDPNHAIVSRLLASVPDWNDMLGGSQLDPLRDLDMLLLAAANPFGANGTPADWFVIARGVDGVDDAMRHAVERMADEDRQRDHPAPSPLHPPMQPTVEPSMQQGMHPAMHEAERGESPEPDAGYSVWHDEGNGVRVAELQRYGARRSFMLLGDGMAAVALPGQVPALMAALSQREHGLAAIDAPSLAVLIEAEGVRNLLEFTTLRGPFPMPSRAALAIDQRLDDDTPTGAVVLRSTWQYDSTVDAEQARAMLEYCRIQWHEMIAERLGAQGGLNRLFAGALAQIVGVDVGALERAIDALQFRVQRDQLVLRGSLTVEQTRALLNLAALGGR